MKNIIQIATAEIGIKEIPGTENTKRIVDYAKEAGFNNITDDETPWCSIFVNWCCIQAGLQCTHKANARSWLSIGKPTDNPIPGDVVIFWREDPNSWKGHVGLFLGFSKNQLHVFTLGGNQKNSVSIQAYSAKNVLGFRQLSPENNIEIPSSNPALKLGSRNDDVKKLQYILNDLGYNCGSVDGVFGQRTETSLKKLQSDNKHEANGVYDTITQNLLENIFQS